MISLALLLIIGLAVVFLLERVSQVRLESVLFLALVPLVGFAFQAFFFFLLSYFGLPWPNFQLLGFLELILAVVVLLNYRGRLSVLIQELINEWITNRWFKFFTVIVVGQLFLIWYSQLHTDYLHADAITIWFLKGKIFFMEKGIPTEIVDDFQTKYPPFVPLVIASVHFFSNHLVPIAAKTLWLVIQTSLLLLLWFISKIVFEKQSWKSLLLPSLYLVTPISWMHFNIHIFGTVDLWLATYYAAALITVYLMVKTQKIGYVVFATVLIASATLIKTEGILALVLLPVILHAFLPLRPAKFRLPILSLAVIPFLMWWNFTSRFNLTDDYLSQVMDNRLGVEAYISKAVMASERLLDNLFRIQGNVFLWPLFFMSTIAVVFQAYKNRKISSALYFPFFVFAGLLLIIAAYTQNVIELDRLVNGSVGRLIAQLTPASIIALGINVNELSKAKFLRKKNS